MGLPESEWPTSTFVPLNSAELPEAKPTKVNVFATHVSLSENSLLVRFSTLPRMQRSFGYVLRFVYSALLKQPRVSSSLSLSELNRAVLFAVRLTQKAHFHDLLRQLATPNKIITPSTTAQLAPFLDKQGLIRVGGRLKNSLLGEEAKYPLLLPKSSHFTSLLINHYHLTYLHAGPALVIAMIRQKYWILSGRDAIRRSIFACVTCTRCKAIHPAPFMGNLPAARIREHRVFSQVGMDYGGPFLVKECRRRNTKTTKVYLALFICMAVKAVHVEVVSDMTADAFLSALDRFVARRGIPDDLYSDCGTNYVGAARQMKALFRDKDMQDSVSTRLPCT